MIKRISVISETSSGRNTRFRDNYTGSEMSRAQLANAIDSGNYQNYHNRVIDGVRTPCSNPDHSTRNNLG